MYVEGRVLVMTTNQPDKLDEALIRPGRVGSDAALDLPQLTCNQVDYQVEFTLATKHQMKEIFIRMYHDEDEDHAVKSDGQPASKTLLQKLSNGSKNAHIGSHLASYSVAAAKSHSQGSNHGNLQFSTMELLKPLLAVPHVEYTRDELEILADAFMAKVVENEFSPAEVQSFLIPRKKDPRKAVEEAAEWFEKLSLHKKAPKESDGADATGAPSMKQEVLLPHDSPMQSDDEESI